MDRVHTNRERKQRPVRQQIYLPDDLAEKLKEHPDMNVSAVCQAALAEAMKRPGGDVPPRGMRLRDLIRSLGDIHDYAQDHHNQITVGQRNALGELYDRLKGLRP